jgi:predicted nucleic acid-binding protein
VRVCDIATDIPNSTDTIFVDTNVWLFQTYPGATLGIPSPRKALIDVYIKYLERARLASATLVALPTVAIELASVIEKAEYREQCRLQGVDPFPLNPASPNTLKACREDAGFRLAVTSYVAQAWLETSSASSVPDIVLSSQLCESAAELASRDGVDPMDALHLKMMGTQGISIILTDDADFLALNESITLLTHNQNSISAAARRGILARR